MTSFEEELKDALVRRIQDLRRRMNGPYVPAEGANNDCLRAQRELELLLVDNVDLIQRLSSDLAAAQKENEELRRLIDAAAAKDAKEAERAEHQGDWMGAEGRECGEHRTTGARAWCFDDSEWCYPKMPCRGCELPALRAEVETRKQHFFAANRAQAAMHAERDAALADLSASHQREEQMRRALEDIEAETLTNGKPHQSGTQTRIREIARRALGKDASDG